MGDVSDAVHDRDPFFYNVAKWKNFSTKKSLMAVMPGSFVGQLVLALMLVQSVVLGSVLIILPLLRGARQGLRAPSVASSWATVWDTKGQQKYSLARPELYPSHAVIDPALMLGMSRELTINTGLDALSHALESIWNRNANAVSTNHAVFAASELLGTLPRLADDLTNASLRARVARAALFAGLAFSNTKTALAHSVSYPITLKYGIPHGLACSFSLPMVMASVLGTDEDCDHSLQRIFGDDLNAGVDRLENFLVSLGVSTNPVDYGVEGEEWRALIDTALTGQRGQNFIGSHARVMQCFISTESESGVRSAH